MKRKNESNKDLHHYFYALLPSVNIGYSISMYPILAVIIAQTKKISQKESEKVALFFRLMFFSPRQNSFHLIDIPPNNTSTSFWTFSGNIPPSTFLMYSSSFSSNTQLYLIMEKRNHERNLSSTFLMINFLLLGLPKTNKVLKKGIHPWGKDW